MTQSQIENRKSQIVIAGAGPAGSSLAIRLAERGYEIVLIERETFPRQKLCGEFISPECLQHFEDLGVHTRMLAAGGSRVTETRFFETGGRSVSVPTNWFGQGDYALSLSRAEMDQQLLQRAREVGVDVREATSVAAVDSDSNGRITSVRTRGGNGDESIAADLFVDATGRSRILAKLAEKIGDVTPTASKPAFIGFKAHLRNVDLDDGVCEIYSFPSGYAGVSHVENGLFNLCFLLKAETVRTVSRDADTLVHEVVMKNKRSAMTLRDAVADSDWLAVSIDSFGAKNKTPSPNLYSIGDAAAFIDPFTGSGMAMALDSSKILFDAINMNETECTRIGEQYAAAYDKHFSSRLRVCSLLRRTAFMPNLATAIVSLLSISTSARRRLARATRGSLSDAA